MQIKDSTEFVSKLPSNLFSEYELKLLSMMYFNPERSVSQSEELPGLDIEDIYYESSQSFSKANPLNIRTKVEGKTAPNVDEKSYDANSFYNLTAFKTACLSGVKLQKVFYL